VLPQAPERQRQVQRIPAESDPERVRPACLHPRRSAELPPADFTAFGTVSALAHSSNVARFLPLSGQEGFNV